MADLLAALVTRLAEASILQTIERNPATERYEDLGVIGVGGMGEVRRVRDRALNRTLAMKVIRRDHVDRPAAVARFVDEAHVGAQLQHPGVTPVHELGYDTIEQEQARDAQLLYKVLDARHGVTSTIITSNLEAEQWAEYLGNPYVTVALLDRLLFHATAITIIGPSYRLNTHRERQRSRGREVDPPQPDTAPSDDAN